MALTQVNRGGLNTGISDSSDATFLTATSGEGVTLAGTLAVTGVHTVGNNAIYTSDGGAVAQNLVQGLAKGWHTLHGTGTIATLDSLNVASIVDSGTGNYGILFTNAFSNKNFSSPSSAAFATGGTKTFAYDRTESDDRSGSTSRHNVGGSNPSGSDTDAQWINSAYLGDLA